MAINNITVTEVLSDPADFNDIVKDINNTTDSIHPQYSRTLFSQSSHIHCKIVNSDTLTEGVIPTLRRYITYDGIIPEIPVVPLSPATICRSYTNNLDTGGATTPRMLTMATILKHGVFLTGTNGLHSKCRIKGQLTTAGDHDIDLYNVKLQLINNSYAFDDSSVTVLAQNLEEGTGWIDHELTITTPEDFWIIELLITYTADPGTNEYRTFDLKNFRVEF